MNTTVLNLETLAVTEYTTPFTGISDDFECTATGLFKVGGDTDDGVDFEPSFAFGLLLPESGRLRRTKYLYLHGTGDLGMTAMVTDGRGNAYSYDALFRHGRAARFTLGAGLRDGYLKVAVRSAGSAPFIIDRASFETAESTNRRL